MAIDINQWIVSGAPLHLNDPRLLAMAEAERHLLEAEYDEYADTIANGAAFCRSAALILMALFLLGHALYVTDPDEEEDDVSTFFSITFPASCRWFSSSVLYNGMGYRYTAMPKAETRSISTSSKRSSIHDTGRTTSGSPLHYSPHSTTRFPSLVT